MWISEFKLSPMFSISFFLNSNRCVRMGISIIYWSFMDSRFWWAHQCTMTVWCREWNVPCTTLWLISHACQTEIWLMPLQGCQDKMLRSVKIYHTHMYLFVLQVKYHDFCQPLPWCQRLYSMWCILTCCTFLGQRKIASSLFCVESIPIWARCPLHRLYLKDPIRWQV